MASRCACAEPGPDDVIIIGARLGRPSELKMASQVDKVGPGEEVNRRLESQQSPIANPLPRAPRRDGNLDSRGGYECVLVDTPPDALQTSCPVCLQILKEPCIVSCCGYKFCRECIERVETAAEKGPCPMCQKPFTHMRERALERSLNDLDVYCTNKKGGCEWKGKLSKLEEHLNRKPTHVNQLRGCQFVEIECIQQCGLRFQRRYVTAHETQQCKKRPYSCDYCRDYDSTFEDVAENHWPRCKLRPIACPNECSVYMIEQQNLDQHLLECPLVEVDCPFHYAGCSVRLPRKNMPSHTQDGNIHVLLLASFSQKLVEETRRLHLRTLEKEEETKLTCKAQQEVVQTLAVENQKLAEENQRLHLRTLEKEEETKLTCKAQQEVVQKLAVENQRLHLRTLEKEDETKLTCKALQEVVHTLEEKMGAEIRLLQAELAEIRSQAAEKDKEMMELSRRYDCTAQQLQGLTQDVATNKTNTDQRFEEANQVDSKLLHVCRLSNHHIQHNQARDKVEFCHVFNKAKDFCGRNREYSLVKEKEFRSMYVPKSPINIPFTEFQFCEHLQLPFPFYTHSRGYKMCLKIITPKMLGMLLGNTKKIGICIMKGPFDAELKWPFRGVVTVTSNMMGLQFGALKFTYDNDTPNSTAGRPINSCCEAMNVPCDDLFLLSLMELKVYVKIAEEIV